MENQNQPEHFPYPQAAGHIQQPVQDQPSPFAQNVPEDEDQLPLEPDSGHIAQIMSMIFFPIILLLGGLIFGIPLAISLALEADSTSFLGIVLGVGVIIGEISQVIVCLFLMGLFASSRTGMIRTSISAAWWLCVWFLVLGCVLFLPVVYFSPQGQQNLSAFSGALAQVVVPYFIVLLIFLASLLLLGICVCSLGGLLGCYLYKSKHNKVPVQYVVIKQEHGYR